MLQPKKWWQDPSWGRSQPMRYPDNRGGLRRPIVHFEEEVNARGEVTQSTRVVSKIYVGNSKPASVLPVVATR